MRDTLYLVTYRYHTNTGEDASRLRNYLEDYAEYALVADSTYLIVAAATPQEIEKELKRRALGGVSCFICPVCRPWTSAGLPAAAGHLLQKYGMNTCMAYGSGLNAEEETAFREITTYINAQIAAQPDGECCVYKDDYGDKPGFTGMLWRAVEQFYKNAGYDLKPKGHHIVAFVYTPNVEKL